MGCLEQGGGHPTLNVALRPQIGLLPFRCEADGNTFKRSLHFQAKEIIHKNDEWLEVAMLLEARLHILLPILLLFRLKTLLWQLVPVREGVCVHDTHVVNTVYPSLPEVVD